MVMRAVSSASRTPPSGTAGNTPSSRPDQARPRCHAAVERGELLAQQAKPRQSPSASAQQRTKRPGLAQARSQRKCARDLAL